MTGNLSKSFYFDVRILAIEGLPFATRLKIVTSKYIALAKLFVTKKAIFAVGKSKLEVASIGDVGTIQSSISDFYDDIVKSGIIRRKAPTIIDVGCNIGQFSTAAKLFYPHSKIIAFEPDPIIYERFVVNLANQKNVEAYNMGLGRKKEDLVFYRSKLSATSSFVLDKEGDVVNKIRLPVNTLDSLGARRADLVKIDVEGFENEVIMGGKSTIGASSYLLVEVSLGRDTKVSNLDIFGSIKAIAGNARVIKFGRPLGNVNKPTCQDVLFKVG